MSIVEWLLVGAFLWMAWLAETYRQCWSFWREEAAFWREEAEMQHKWVDEIIKELEKEQDETEREA